MKKVKGYAVIHKETEFIIHWGGQWLIFEEKSDAEKYIGNKLNTKIVEVEISYDPTKSVSQFCDKHQMFKNNCKDWQKKNMLDSCTENIT